MINKNYCCLWVSIILYVSKKVSDTIIASYLMPSDGLFGLLVEWCGRILHYKTVAGECIWYPTGFIFFVACLWEIISSFMLWKPNVSMISLNHCCSQKQFHILQWFALQQKTVVSFTLDSVQTQEEWGWKGSADGKKDTRKNGPVTSGRSVVIFPLEEMWHKLML